MHHSYMNKRLTGDEMDNLIDQEAGRVYSKAAFGVLIILVVFLPILALVGIEGKMFRPMAQTVSFALLGALVLSLTYVPVAASLFLSKTVRKPWAVSEKIMLGIAKAYKPALNLALNKPNWVVGLSAGVLIITGLLFSRMGSEFLPDLEEGDLAMQMAIKPGSALSESIRTSTKAEKILMANFPEIKHVVSKIGTAEIPTDPMAIEDADIMIILKPKEEWVSATNREDLANLMKEKLEAVLGASFEFTQPIQLRFNELLSGAKADIAIQIFGDDTDELFRLGNRVKALTEGLPGAADLKVEQTEGLPQLKLEINREKMARHGISIDEVNRTVRAAFAGEVSGTIFESERRFDLVIRLDSAVRQTSALDMLYVNNNQGNSLPLSEVVTAHYVNGPMQISRENARRRITIGVNVRNRDMGSLVADITKVMDNKLKLPPGYTYSIGGQYENFIHARERLQIAVPIALLLILVLLFFAFNSVKFALIIFAAVPLSAVGGVVALLMRGMPFSISAGVGFIALFGVAVLNGIVFIGHAMELAKSESKPLDSILKQAAVDRLRPVLITAAVAIMGFLPMALSTGAGAEVQKPLATVVIGGLISATFLTMLVLPALLLFIHNIQKQRLMKKANKPIAVVVLLLLSAPTFAQQQLSREAATDSAFANNPEWLNAGLDVAQATALKNTAVALDPLSFEYNQGQLNAPNRDDYQFIIQQDFGSLLTHVRKSQELNAREDLAEANLLLKSRELRYEVALRYEAWIYAFARFKLAKREFERFKQLGEKLENQFLQGEISALERNRNKNQVYQFYTLLLNEENKWLEATRSMNELLLIQRQILPADTALLPRLIQPDTALSTILLQSAALAITVEEKRARSERANFFPALSAGYLNQKIETDVGLQGFIIGMRIPLWFVPQNARVKEAQLEALKRQNDFNGLQKRFDVALKTQWNTYANYRLRWQESIQDALKNAESLQSLSEQSFLQGEIDYLNLAQSIESALALKFTYLENLFLMNQSALKLEYLVNPN
jgi:cobalt-zinc-cadmium resistance protein CzcA